MEDRKLKFKKTFEKQTISIQAIGKQRFWLGLIIGIICSIVLALSFSYTRESFRLFSIFSGDLLILENREIVLLNFFFAVLSSVLGLSISLWFWAGNKKYKRKKERLYQSIAQTQTLFIFWLILMVIARLSTTILILIHTKSPYNKELDLINNYWILFILLPLVVFAHNWFAFRLFYRIKKWVFYSFLFCIANAFVLHFSFSINQEKLNKIYHQQYAKDYEQIDSTLAQAKKYGVEFDAQTISILKRWNTDNSIKQVIAVKKAFSPHQKVSLDTLILAKIVTHHFKNGSKLLELPVNSLKNWHYALPFDILHQLKLNDPHSAETKELFNILEAQIQLINIPTTPNFTFEDFSKPPKNIETHKDLLKLSVREREKRNKARHYIPKDIIHQLKKVLTILAKEKEYEEYIQKLSKTQ